MTDHDLQQEIKRLTAELEAMRGIAYDRAKEAAIAWSVCHSIHQKYCKGRDPFYTTRAADFARDEVAARAAAVELAQDVAELGPRPALPGGPV
jgi:hypothetical protein